MPKVRDSSGTIGTMYLPICLSLSSLVKKPTKAIVVETSRSPLPSKNSWKSSMRGISARDRLGRARRHEAAQRLAALA